MRPLFSLFAIMLLAPGASAQSPYADLVGRPVKALSEQSIDELRQGRGMGLALAAELNGYPGPVHVLELGTELKLSDGQLARVTELHTAMQSETVPIGIRLIALETELDELFARRRATAAEITRLTTLIGSTQAALRAAHLRYHLVMMDILTEEQISTYGRLRGYDGAIRHPAMHQGHQPAHGRPVAPR